MGKSPGKMGRSGCILWEIGLMLFFIAVAWVIK